MGPPLAISSMIITVPLYSSHLTSLLHQCTCVGAESLKVHIKSLGFHSFLFTTLYLQIGL